MQLPHESIQITSASSNQHRDATLPNATQPVNGAWTSSSTISMVVAHAGAATAATSAGYCATLSRSTIVLLHLTTAPGVAPGPIVKESYQVEGHISRKLKKVKRGGKTPLFSKVAFIVEFQNVVYTFPNPHDENPFLKEYLIPADLWGWLIQKKSVRIVYSRCSGKECAQLHALDASPGLRNDVPHTKSSIHEER
eukprot:scaffold90806_cov19-Tisochrysis_lutea.AAC.1